MTEDQQALAAEWFLTGLDFFGAGLRVLLRASWLILRPVGLLAAAHPALALRLAHRLEAGLKEPVERQRVARLLVRDARCLRSRSP
ncbi:MAG: hypothetical protein GEU68_12785 [Actinobacteria bacterium]|nr:hypothetical protein [Actinomycetota bacterium]